MKTLFITHDTKLDGVTLEEVMDTLGVKKHLTLEEKQKASIIEDINKNSRDIDEIKFGKGASRPIPAKTFDQLYDESIKTLVAIERGVKEHLSYVRYQAGLSGQIDPKSPIQGHDF